MSNENVLRSENNINKNIFIGVIGTILLKVISFVTVIIVGYLMTKEEYGNLSTYNTWVIIIGVFVGLQFNGSIQNALMEYGEKNIYSYCNTVLSFSFGFFVLLFLPTIIMNDMGSNLLKIDNVLFYFLVPQTYGSFLVNYMSSYLLAKKEVKYNFFWTLIYSVLISSLSLSLCAISSNKVFGYSLGIFLPNVVMGLVVILFFVIKSKFTFIKEYLVFGLKFSIPIIFHILGSVILGQSDKLMIRYFLTETETGQYSMIHNYAMLINSVWAAFNGVFLPYFYDYLKNDNKKMLLNKSKNYYIVFTCISLGFILVGRELVKLIVNKEFYDGLVILELSVLSQYFIFLYSFCSNYEFYHKKTIWIAIGTIISAMLNIGLNALFIRIWGIFGVALASAISYLILIIFHELISRFIIKNYPYAFYYTLICTILSCVITVISILLRDYFIIRWVFGALFGVILVINIIKNKAIL